MANARIAMLWFGRFWSCPIRAAPRSGRSPARRFSPLRQWTAQTASRGVGQSLAKPPRRRSALGQGAKWQGWVTGRLVQRRGGCESDWLPRDAAMRALREAECPWAAWVPTCEDDSRNLSVS